MFKLRTKISLALILTSMVSVILISILANFLLENQFRQYIIKKQDDTNKAIVNLISQQYIPMSRWNKEAIESIGVNALEQGMIVKVKDTSGKMIWDATKHNSGLCLRMLEHMTKNMTSRYGKWVGKYTEVKYPIISNSNAVGFVEIGYYGPFYFNDNDLAFINTLNIALSGIAVFVVIFSLLFGVILSRRISVPIEKVIMTAQNISKGNYNVRSKQKSNTKEINQLVSSINDVAESLRAQETLRKQLTADVAHELRTPMSILQSHIEAMRDGIWEPTTERLNSCHEEIIRLNKMIGDLGKLAKYEGENLTLNKSQFSLAELISNIMMNFEREFKSKGIEVNYERREEAIYADKDKISQVIINLLSNALKYTPAGGKISIEVKSIEGFTEISVQDNGQGISEEDLPHIFERFYRADKSRNKATGGVGIGLTITKSIVQAHGGTIKVESILNEGTKFIISLPYN